MRAKILSTVLLTVLIGIGCQSQKKTVEADNTETTIVGSSNVIMTTNFGIIELELYPDKVPVSVENFLTYVKEGYYSNTIFHRVIKGFMIQGGGFTFDGTVEKKETKPPIINEAGISGLKNRRGTISYARTSDLNSATAQFFINHADNSNLDNPNSPYAVFGMVVQGMDVVDKIANLPTKAQSPFRSDFPVEVVLIESIRIK